MAKRENRQNNSNHKKNSAVQTWFAGSGLLLGVLAGVALFLSLSSRLFFLDEPMSRDEGAYAYLGKMAMNGELPYVDFYEMKPPLLYYLYGIGGVIFGTGDTGLRLFALFLIMVSSSLIFLIVKRFYSPSSGILSAAVFSFLSLNLYTMGFTMVAEHLVNVFILASILVGLQLQNSPKTIGWALSGLLLGIAVLVKQVAVVFVPMVLFLIFNAELKTKQYRLKSIIIYGAGMALTIGIVLLLVGLMGDFDEMIYWLIEYPLQYTSSVDNKEGMFYLKQFLSRILAFSPLVFGLISISVLLSLIDFKSATIKWLWIYLACGFLSLIPGLRFYGQYWILLMPVLSIFLANGVVFLQKRASAAGVLFGSMVCVLIFMELGFKQNYYYNTGLSRPITKLYSNNPFKAIRELSTYLKSKMTDKDQLLVLGSEPQIYLYTGKKAPLPHVYSALLMRNNPKNVVARDEIIKYLEQKRPNYVFFNLFPFSWMIQEGDDDALYRQSFVYMVNNYEVIASYDIAADQYKYADQGQTSDAYKANQLLVFKRR
ncbi:MAG: glycosyltransferase family 39 protein [Saprospiraceae bacterium]|nr:glycosyltransferase family 39 protein [Saprospiraceae bacterium]